MRTLVSALAITAALGFAASAQAYEAGDWLFRVGASNVDPKSDNGSLDLSAVDPALSSTKVNVQDAWGLTFNVTYMYTPNVGVEVLAALPFDHDIKLGNDLGEVGSVKHLPPTISLQYHFLPDAAFQPYVGAGLNLTWFFDESESGVLSDLGGSLKLDSTSFGAAVQAGFDYQINEKWFVNVDVRWIDINVDADVTIPGVGTLSEEVEIDPIVYGVHLGYKF